MPGTVPIMSRRDQLWREKAQIRHADGGFESLRHEKPEAKTRRKPGLAAGEQMRARPRSARARTEVNNRPTTPPIGVRGLGPRTLRAERRTSHRAKAKLSRGAKLGAVTLFELL